eukprot:SAG11_NODE_2705_length_3073_cov_2.609953_1_plen_145_part_10
MIIHELALAVTFFNVTADNLANVAVDPAGTTRETRGAFTDYRRLAFTLTTSAGDTVTVKADRCGGNNSQAVISNTEGVEMFRSIMPDAELEAQVLERAAADPATFDGGFGYFFTQHDDYVALKQRLVHKVLAGERETPAGVASLD